VSDSPADGNTEEQTNALYTAIADLQTNSPSGRRRFVVFVTDAYMSNSSQLTHLDIVQNLDALTGSNGGGVFVSLWEQWQGSLYQHYSQSFTNDPAYPSLAVNGGFDHTNYANSAPADGRYMFDTLKKRILYSQ